MEKKQNAHPCNGIRSIYTSTPLLQAITSSRKCILSGYPATGGSPRHGNHCLYRPQHRRWLPRMQEEIEQLELLEKLNRLLPEEKARLTGVPPADWKRSWSCPALKFTATFGFHIIGIFPPDKPVREIEHCCST